ncbi:MAG: hypothetical protein J0M04_16300 [Verrucomicrobia bacterium]|nr:hypothetical protein [Verrucomicrobiota bacterium]
MKLSATGSTTPFEAYPEYDGQAVCVDVTPLKKTQSSFGERETFRIVFETRELRQDGKPYLLFSRGFTPSLHEKAALRQFLKQWLGRDLTVAEQNEFDTENLIGRPARVSVVHSDYNGTTYANIGLIRPDRSGEPLRPSGKYVRQKDRQNNDGRFNPASNTANDAPADWRRVKVHVGRHSGLDLGELDRESVEALHAKWLPTALAMPKPLKADRDLIAALKQAKMALDAGQVEDEEDNIPF